MTGRRTCVRCARNPRADELFICTPCHDDPATYREMTAARGRTTGDYLAQQRYLIAVHGWAGGWPRLDRRAPAEVH